MKMNNENESTIKAMVDSYEEEEERIVTAIKIDVIERTITEVESSGYESICELLECDGIDHWTMNQFNDSVYVDGEGWLDRKTIGGFKINGNFFAGHGLVIGTNSEGKSIDPCFTVDMLERITTFVGVDKIDQIKEKYYM